MTAETNAFDLTQTQALNWQLPAFDVRELFPRRGQSQ